MVSQMVDHFDLLPKDLAKGISDVWLIPSTTEWFNREQIRGLIISVYYRKVQQGIVQKVDQFYVLQKGSVEGNLDG